MKDNWRPTTTVVEMQQRAELLTNIRNFFHSRKVLEVETPLLCQYAPTMPYIDPIAVEHRFLQTSPEYSMKRLLASGSGDIFQICKSFRGHEQGLLHNPEFTMLEWYRLKVDHHYLMQETVELLQACGINYRVSKVAYRDIFYRYLRVDPVVADLAALQQSVYRHINLSSAGETFVQNASKASCQEILFSHLVEPNLVGDVIWLIYNYPQEQAALAKLIQDSDQQLVAARFEVYVSGAELANGFYELTDPVLQQQRFIREQQARRELKKPYLEIDPYFIGALASGLPECSGIALGVDRLLMLKLRASSIDKVINFPWHIA